MPQRRVQLLPTLVPGPSIPDSLAHSTASARCIPGVASVMRPADDTCISCCAQPSPQSGKPFVGVQESRGAPGLYPEVDTASAQPTAPPMTAPLHDPLVSGKHCLGTVPERSFTLLARRQTPNQRF